jgi:hypothetical protein
LNQPFDFYQCYLQHRWQGNSGVWDIADLPSLESPEFKFCISGVVPLVSFFSNITKNEQLSKLQSSQNQKLVRKKTQGQRISRYYPFKLITRQYANIKQTVHFTSD